jgi:hypothetical protein
MGTVFLVKMFAKAKRKLLQRKRRLAARSSDFFATVLEFLTN